ncbi:MAG: hypothetical protein EBS82_07515 [Methylocystaceae bacterium]|nr:hypothetical protein [Methylocystaceae bacterium]
MSIQHNFRSTWSGNETSTRWDRRIKIDPAGDQNLNLMDRFFTLIVISNVCQRKSSALKNFPFGLLKGIAWNQNRHS